MCAKPYGGVDWVVIHNDNDRMKEFIKTNPLLGGFNCKNYDCWIMKGILIDSTPEQVKQINDWIIGGNEGWNYPIFKYTKPMWFDSFDLMDDMQTGQSLKSIEGHLGMDIRQSSISFDIDHEWDADELAEMIAYCKADVCATEKLMEIRQDYLRTKVELGKRCGLTERQAIKLTNAALTAKYLNAEKQELHDEREFDLPHNVNLSLIPDEVKQFFDRAKNPDIPDDKVFEGNVEFEVGGCPTTVGYGGIHAALPNLVEKACDGRVIRNWDVASLYPSLMINYNYTSRGMPDPKQYEEVYRTRLAAKKSGDKTTANSLKLVLNTTYGAMLNGKDGIAFNPLYDARMGRSVCVGGQLLILELAQRYVQIPSVKLLQLNTDGVMVSCDEGDLDRIHAINEEWMHRTGFGLQEDEIDCIWQKDVNNYVMRFCDGHTKTKGAYFKEGISTAGAFSVNNDMNIVKRAVRDYFLYGTPVEETIWECMDPRQFQIIAKAGHKYSRVYMMVENIEVTIQNCNRVYATKDIHCGTLYKVHKETGKAQLIAGLPEHCIIDNEGVLGIEAIDNQWYVDVARKRINDFLGIKQTKRRKKTMATGGKMNLLQKLLEARVRMSQSGLTKDGKNMMLAYKYFTLDDIVNKATPIFKDLGLLPVTRFEDQYAYMDLYDADAPDVKPLTFTSPMRPGVVNKGVTEIQSLGGVETYQRRYLLMALLDIVQGEEDPDSGIQQSMGEAVIAPKQEAPKTINVETAKKAPVTAEERKEVKVQLTAVDGAADATQIKALKSAMSKLRKEKPNELMWIMQIAKDTESFTKMTRKEADDLIVEIGEKLA